MTKDDIGKDDASWKFESTESDGRIWLTIHHPGGAKATLSARATTDDGRNSTICAQVIRDLVGGTQAECGKDSMDTLVAVLNAIGYTEEFAEAHPNLKVSEGVKLFLQQRADGGKGEAVAMRVRFGAREPEIVSWNVLPDGEHNLYTTPQAECAPREAVAEVIVANSGKALAWGKTHWYMMQAGTKFYTTPQAECAPREAQPVAWRYFDGEGNYEYREDPPSESSIHHAAIYGRKFEPLYLASPTPERADAEKDTALTDAEIIELFDSMITDNMKDPAIIAFARAILAANKEK